MPVEMINPTHWKKNILYQVVNQLTGEPYKRLQSDESKLKRWKKLLTKQYGKEKANKRIIYDALVMLGFQLPAFIKNPTTNKKIAFKYDISDALGILISYYIDLPKSWENRLTWNFEIIT
jgi:hypothetical protein